jgi:hypothetical protein
MASWNKLQPFPEALAEGVHDLGSDQIKVALCAAAHAPNATDVVLTDLTEVTYTNLSTRNVTTTTSAQTSGTYKLVLQDLTLTSTGGSPGPFRYIVLYNDTAASDNLLGYYDYGSDLTLNDGESLTLDFSEASGVLTLA